jgi:hypothetical protein
MRRNPMPIRYLVVLVVVSATLLVGAFVLTPDVPDAADLLAPKVADRSLPLLSGRCDIAASDGQSPAGCRVDAGDEGGIPEIESPPGTLPLELTTGVLSLSVVSGPAPDAVELLTDGPGRWRLSFPDAPEGRYRVLLTTEVAQVSEFVLVVTPFAAAAGRGQSDTGNEGATP